MEIIFGENKEFFESSMPSRSTTNGLVCSGCFSRPDPFSWYSCREEFLKKVTYDEEGYYFTKAMKAADRPDPDRDVASFILKTEMILGLVNPVGRSSRFARTNRPYALWIDPSPFWKKCKYRFSFLTILLRSANEYFVDRDNYEEALFSDPYAKDTKLAVKRFLFGYTKFVYNSNDELQQSDKITWRDYFVNKPVAKIRQELILPEGATVPKSIIGVGSIWN